MPEEKSLNSGSASAGRNRLTRTFTLLLALLIFTAGGVTVIIIDQAIFHPRIVNASETDSDLPSSIKEAWTIVHEWYVDSGNLDDRKLADGTIAGMLNAVGDEGHTRYLNASELARYHAGISGSYIGVGIQLAKRNKHIVVVSPIDRSPAQQAGVNSGDILLRINGREVKDETMDQVVEQIRGPEGSSIELSLERPGKSGMLTVTLKRAELKVSPVSWTMLPGKVAQVRLSQFSLGAADALADAVKKAGAAGASGIVLDLRNNPGGLVSEAIGVGSVFLPEGSPVFVSQSQDGRRITHRAFSNENRTELPLTVLVNQGTASASEIVAGALKDNDRAKVVGEKTFGTGTLLNQFSLSNGGAALIGTEFWLTPNKEPIRGHGIDPDIAVGLAAGQAYIPAAAQKATEQDIRNDSQLLRAISLLDGNSTPESYAKGGIERNEMIRSSAAK